MCQLSFLLLTSSVILGAQTQSLYEETIRLKRVLFTNHSVDIRPVKNVKDAVSLDINVKVNDAFLKDFVLTSRIYLKITWLDNVLQWQSEDYANITHLHLKETDLWSPRFQVSNSVSDGSFECHDKVVKIYNDGKVEFDCRSVFKLRCETAFVRFPFDEHKCEILMFIPDYDSEEVQIKTTTIERRESQKHQSKSWKIKNLRVLPSEFQDSAALSVILELERNFLFHLAFAIFPVMIVSLLVPLTFLMRDNVIKILYSLLVFLLMILLVFQILTYLPKTCNCAFNLYIIGCLLFLNFVSIIVSVAMYKYKYNYRNPRLQEAPTPTDETRFQDFLYDFRNPHNFLFNEKILKNLVNQRCFTCCSPSVDDVFSAELKTYFKTRANKKKCSNHKMFIVFMLIWSALTALYFVKIFQII